MSEIELAGLQAEIEGFLRHVGYGHPTERQDWAFWRDRPIIRTPEIEMLDWLSRNPADAAAIACYLQSDVPATQALLSGLISIGLIERDADCFRVSDATRQYLRMHLGT